MRRMVSKELTKEFQLAVSEELGVDLNDSEAAATLAQLVSYFNLLTEIEERKTEVFDEKHEQENSN